MDQDKRKTDFGFQEVFEEEKPGLVRDLFSRVADRYDLMNDLMSFGLHRLWKQHFLGLIPKRPQMKLLDVAGGTGDIALKFLKSMEGLEPSAVVYDMTPEMLQQGQDKAYDRNILKGIEWVCGTAEDLPFDDHSFDVYTISFGLRNVTDKTKTLSEAYRVLKPGSPFFCLEFSQIQGPLAPLYNLYAMKLIPLLGKLVSDQKEAYRYLSESIEKFPEAGVVENMMKDAGFQHVQHEKLCSGLVAIHQGWKEK